MHARAQTLVALLCTTIFLFSSPLGLRPWGTRLVKAISSGLEGQVIMPLPAQSSGGLKAHIQGSHHAPSRLTPFAKVLADTARRREINAKREQALGARQSMLVSQVHLGLFGACLSEPSLARAHFPPWKIGTEKPVV